MYCTCTLTIACLKMFLRSRQALFFSLFFPVTILLIFGSIDFDTPAKLKIGLVLHHPSPPTAQFVEAIRFAPMLTTDVGTLEAERAELERGNLTAVLDIPDDLPLPGNEAATEPIAVYLNSARPMERQMAEAMLNQFADRVTLSAMQAPALFAIKEEVKARDLRYIDFLLPGVISMSIMQMSVFSVAFVFVRYKEQGILKRLLATPMRPHQFVAANIITRLCMAVTQAALFIILGRAYFHVPIAGAYWLLALCVVLGSLMFLGLGFTVSGLSKNLETVPVLANIVVFPMLFLCNVFFSASNMPAWLRVVADYLPLTFLSSAMRGVMTDGAGPLAIRRDLIGMVLWATVLISLAIATFRFQEREGA
jgi:ABC-2 type transport system permease protein